MSHPQRRVVSKARIGRSSIRELSGFAFASVASMATLGAGLAASGYGCSSASCAELGTCSGPAVEGDGSADGNEAGAADSTPSIEDGGVEFDARCPTNGPFDETTIEKDLDASYRGPTPPRSACTQDDFRTFEINLQSAKTFEALGSGLSTSCKSCIFSTTDAASWGPIVFLAGNTAMAFANFGACHAAINSSAACGRAYQYERFCTSSVCSDCVGTEIDACLPKAIEIGGACESLHESIAANCPLLSKSLKDCGPTLASHAKVLCGPL